MRISVTDDFFVDIESTIVYVYVPLLLELYVLVRTKLILNFDKFTMSSKVDGWMTSLVNKLKHV